MNMTNWPPLGMMVTMKKHAPKPSDTQLVERCLRGEAVAWRLLVERYARLVHSVPARHGLSPAEVDDVGQEVFLALAQNLHQVDDPKRLAAWLITTARRLSWRAIQAGKREQPVAVADLAELDVVGEHAHPIRTPMPSIAQLQNAWERQEALEQGLARLQERCRTLPTLLFLDPQEPSYDDICTQIGIAKGSIGPTRARCLQQLRSILEGLNFDPYE